MSGHKHATVTISESEYRRLNDLNIKARFSQLKQKNKKKVQDQSENDAVNSLAQTFDRRQNEFQSYISALDNEVGQIERETAQVLEQQQKYLSAQISSIQEDALLGVNELVQNLTAQVDTSIRRHQYELTALRHHLNLLTGNNAQKVELAENWLSSASSLREFIETHYDHTHLLSGQFNRIDLQIQQASANLEVGLPEAALVGAQQAYLECSQARIDMERLMTEWQILFQVASSAVEELFHEISTNNYIPAMDLSGNELPFMIDLDHWSVHRFTNLLRSVRSYRSRLRAGSQRFTSTELTDLIQNAVPRFKKEFDEIIYEARLEVIYSQIRINIADIAIQALGRQGFIMQEHGYTESDMRKPYFISLQNIEGSKVTILVNPMKNMKAVNDLVIDSFDTSTRTESELRSRSLEIFQTLNQFGLQVGPISIDRGGSENGLQVTKKEAERSKSFLQ